MTRDTISVYLPEAETSQSIAYTEAAAAAVDYEKGMTIENAAANKNNSLSIIIENSGTSDSSVIFVAGDTYPNSMLGDLEIPLTAQTFTICQLQDLSRFENRDGSINLDFAEEFTGNIIAAAKRAGIAPVE